MVWKWSWVELDPNMVQSPNWYLCVHSQPWWREDAKLQSETSSILNRKLISHLLICSLAYWLNCRVFSFVQSDWEGSHPAQHQRDFDIIFTSSKIPTFDLENMDVLCTYKINFERKIQNMIITKSSYLDFRTLHDYKLFWAKLICVKIKFSAELSLLMIGLLVSRVICKKNFKNHRF